MIDPRRKAANDEKARKLIALERLAMTRAQDQDPVAIALLRRLNRTRSERWGVPTPFEAALDQPDSPLKISSRAWRLSEAIVEQAVEPLRRALRAQEEPATFIMHGTEYRLEEPEESRLVSFFDIKRGEHFSTQEFAEALATAAAPLTLLTSRDLIEATIELGLVVLDPTPNAELAIEQPDYARQRTALIEIEHWLWQQAWKHGAHSNILPYPNRTMLLILSWRPEAHKPPGAHTVCVRCGELTFRKGSNITQFPRCRDCMKETPAQRAWPKHAVTPFGRGTWMLACHYPDCDNVFEGPRHQKLCSEHTSSRLAPGRRLSNMR